MSIKKRKRCNLPFKHKSGIWTETLPFEPEEAKNMGWELPKDATLSDSLHTVDPVSKDNGDEFDGK